MKRTKIKRTTRRQSNTKMVTIIRINRMSSINSIMLNLTTTTMIIMFRSLEVLTRIKRMARIVLPKIIIIQECL
jgi:hypothetical protein